MCSCCSPQVDGDAVVPLSLQARTTAPSLAPSLPVVGDAANGGVDYANDANCSRSRNDPCCGLPTASSRPALACSASQPAANQDPESTVSDCGVHGSGGASKPPSGGGQPTARTDALGAALTRAWHSGFIFFCRHDSFRETFDRCDEHAHAQCRTNLCSSHITMQSQPLLVASATFPLSNAPRDVP